MSGSRDKTVRIWAANGTCERVLEGHTNGVTCVAALEGGRIASAGSDASVRIWGPDGTCERVLENYYVNCVAGLPGGKVAAGHGAFYEENVVRIYGPTDKTETLGCGCVLM